jgi:hypothetical protein
LAAKAAELDELDGLSIEDPLEAAVADRLWQAIESLGIVTNAATLVSGSKTLHHILPDLVVPIDRVHMRTFLACHSPAFQYRQADVFHQAFPLFASIGRQARPSRLVGIGWRSSSTKLIENAIIGYCLEEDVPVPS